MSPRRPSTDRAAVLEAALALLDEDGLEALTMRRLGARLGVDPMTVYRYVPGRGALLDAIAETVWAEAATSSDTPSPSWREEIARVSRGLRAALLRRPAAAVLVATRPVATPAQLALAERTVAALVAGGLDPAEAMRLLDITVAYTTGKVLGELRDPTDAEGTDPRAARERLDAAGLPHLARALADGYYWAPEREFAEGLRALIAGWGR